MNEEHDTLLQKLIALETEAQCEEAKHLIREAIKAQRKANEQAARTFTVSISPETGQYA